MIIKMNDIIIKICDYLYDYDKLCFLSITKKHNERKKNIHFNEKVHVTKIKKLNYFDSFTNIKIEYGMDKYPKSLTSLTIDNNSDEDIEIPKTIKNLTIKDANEKIIKNLCEGIEKIEIGFTIKNMKKYIPKSVKHLKIGSLCRYSDVTNCIPENVTHLTISGIMTETIKGKIPTNVTHLILDDVQLKKCDRSLKNCFHEGLISLELYGTMFEGELDGCIPHSIKHLVINEPGRNIKIKAIPEGVTYLDIGTISIDNIPNTVTHLIMCFNDEKWRFIPPSVIYLDILGAKYKKNLVPKNVKHLVFQNYRKECAPRNIPLHVEFVTYKNVDLTMINRSKLEMIDLYDIPAHIKMIVMGPLTIRNINYRFDENNI